MTSPASLELPSGKVLSQGPRTWSFRSHWPNRQAQRTTEMRCRRTSYQGTRVSQTLKMRHQPGRTEHRVWRPRVRPALPHEPWAEQASRLVPSLHHKMTNLQRGCLSSKERPRPNIELLLRQLQTQGGLGAGSTDQPERRESPKPVPKQAWEPRP